MLEWKFEDARMPTDAERRNLSRLIYLAFVDMRMLLLNGDPQQAKDLADAFHNVPLYMHTNDFSFKAFRDLLGVYQQKYSGKARLDYLQEWEKLNAIA
jgi:hypothetical protein